MNSTISSIIQNWVESSGIYSFEIRLALNVDPKEIVPTDSIMHYNFIIEVRGFFEDKACKKPIKLHHEEVLDIDDSNVTQQYTNNFIKRLDTFTQTAYDSFKEKLASFDQPIISSDPLHMNPI